MNYLVDAMQSDGKVVTANLTSNRVRVAIDHWENYSTNDKIQGRFKKGTSKTRASLKSARYSHSCGIHRLGKRPTRLRAPQTAPTRSHGCLWLPVLLCKALQLQQ